MMRWLGKYSGEKKCVGANEASALEINHVARLIANRAGTGPRNFCLFFFFSLFLVYRAINETAPGCAVEALHFEIN